jgi:hypothetical protein
MLFHSFRDLPQSLNRIFTGAQPDLPLHQEFEFVELALEFKYVL